MRAWVKSYGPAVTNTTFETSKKHCLDIFLFLNLTVTRSRFFSRRKKLIAIKHPEGPELSLAPKRRISQVYADRSNIGVGNGPDTVGQACF